ncbi:DUF6502 family protein [Agitococcus lubricus]|uniref:Uncharacterized protein n=1 Tax=Agitococcus lubricus TaxID=1077255 RepID=A0A2T5J0U2_9GAMM|nr:DUF6502 family protein [Agitococcus lubricus]PTQ90005.1 hypothetical protein C8N29_10443 [Agitococcus lubricus]
MKAKHSLLVLDTVLSIMQRLVAWLIRHGITYVEFAQALKKVFLQQALLEAERLGSKKTDSALSLLSGLQRRDVQLVRTALEEQPIAAITRSTVPAEVIGKWLANQDIYPDALVFMSDNPEVMSFEKLVLSVSKDKHPRSILNELIRIKVVEWDEVQDTICLQHKAFLPDQASEQLYQLFARILNDHLAASTYNLETAGREKFLDQAVFADGLAPESIAILEQYSRKKWQAFMQEMLTFADILCEADKVKSNADQRFTVAMFNYAERQNMPVDVIPPAPTRD